jgi:glucokinase
VYFSGSIVNSLLQPEELESFRADFENSSTMQELLVTIPIFLIKDLNLGLRGGLVLALRD